MPNKIGRPSKFQTINLEQAKQLYVHGWTDVQVAKFFGVAVSSIYEWKNNHPKFSEALKDWKLKADSQVERSLYERAVGYRTKYKKNFVVSDGKDSGSHVEKHDEEIAWAPDPTSCIFWLKNRRSQEWREKSEIQININLADRIKTSRMASIQHTN